jgi:hypothetical protein
LNNRGDALETHSSVDVALREGIETKNRNVPAGKAGSIFRYSSLLETSDHRVKLDKNEVPDLDAARVFFVHQRAARIPIRCKIDMYL